MNPFLQFLNYSLFPLSVLYDIVTQTRNKFYQKQYFKTETTKVFSICVGNIAVGGTGKTPHIEYLIRLLSDSYEVTTISRGYGRKTKGFLIADQNSTAQSIGDEPMQFFIKFGHKIKVIVGEKRVLAAQKLIQNFPKTQIILLDDAFQHRAISANLNILLTDYHQLFYKDFLLPMGRLRENRQGIQRANAIIVTKIPENLSNEEKQYIEKNINKYAKNNIPIFWSSIIYLPLTPLFSITKSVLTSKNVILVTGLANNMTLEKYIQKHYNLLKTITLADHQDYTISDIEFLVKEYTYYNSQSNSQNPIIITTEKDMVKLQNPIFFDLLKNLDVYYLPICIKIDKEFDEFIMKYL